MTTAFPGFAEPVFDAQSCFRAVLDAMAYPGRVIAAGGGLRPPAPLSPAAAAVLLTLTDGETAIWLGPGMEITSEWLRFHCGAPEGEPDLAAFALCLELPPLDALLWGTYDGPECSATVILQRPHFDAGPTLRLSGPGLLEATTVRLGLPVDFAARWRPNHESFPRGVDLIVCAGCQLAAIPRSIRVEAV